MARLTATLVASWLLSVTVVGAAGNTPDPTLLIGRWEGDARGARVTGRILVIDRVEMQDGRGMAYGSWTVAGQSIESRTTQMTVAIVEDAVWMDFYTGGTGSRIQLKLAADAKTLSGTITTAGNASVLEVRLAKVS